MLLTIFATHSTTTSPRFHHSKNTKIAKTLSKKPHSTTPKLFLQKT
jgi:hypothetical protein